MSKFEELQTVSLNNQCGYLHRSGIAELAHFEDYALDVMIDFTKIDPPVINQNASIDDAQQEMKTTGLNLLLVINNDDKVVGIISSEDILGEKPIKLIQEKRIKRAKIQVKMLMIKPSDIVAFDLEALRHIKLGSVIHTFNSLNKHNALVVHTSEKDKKQRVRGMFSLLMISKQLHMDISTITGALSISELQERHT